MPRPAALVLAVGLVAAVAAGDTASACSIIPPAQILTLELVEVTVDGAPQPLPAVTASALTPAPGSERLLLSESEDVPGEVYARDR